MGIANEFNTRLSEIWSKLAEQIPGLSYAPQHANPCCSSLYLHEILEEEVSEIQLITFQIPKLCSIVKTKFTK